MTVDGLIEELGGTSEVAEALGVDPPVVSNWRKRGKIPSDWWSQIVEMAARLAVSGISLEAVAAMHARPTRIEART